MYIPSKTESETNVKISEIIDCPQATMMKTIQLAGSRFVVNLRGMKKNLSHLLCSFSSLLGPPKKCNKNINIRTEEMSE